MIKTSHTACVAVSAVTIALAGAVAANAATLAEIQESGTVRVAAANEISYGDVDPLGEALGAGPDVAKAIMAELDPI